MPSDDTPQDREMWRQAARQTPRLRCPDLNDLASYADGRMDASAAALLEEHLCGCADCRQAIAVARSVAAPAAQARPARLLTVLRWTGMAAAFVLACALGFRLGQGRAADARALALIEDAAPAMAPELTGGQP